MSFEIAPASSSQAGRSAVGHPGGLAGLQQGFAAAVMTGEDGLIAGHIWDDGEIPTETRLGIYRNNIFGSLIGVLAAAFPTVETLLTPKNFRIVGRAFVKEHPPRVPQLLRYGGAFPDFLAAFKHTRAMGHIIDLARLEWLQKEVLFAADALPLDPAALSTVAAEHLGAVRFVLHPAVRLMTSRYPVQSLFAAMRGRDGPKLPVDVNAGGEQVLVTRPGHAVQARVVPAAEHAFLAGLRQGDDLATAIEAAAGLDAAFDLQTVLATHFAAGTFVEVVVPPP